MERLRETDGEIQRDRERLRETDVEIQREIQRDRCRDSERQREIQRDRERFRETERDIHRDRERFRETEIICCGLPWLLNRRIIPTKRAKTTQLPFPSGRLMAPYTYCYVDGEIRRREEQGWTGRGCVDR